MNAAIADSPPPQVLFICSGNYYRSRFAEEVFNAECARRGLPWKADSVGLRVTENRYNNPGPISVHARQALARFGITPLAAEREPRQIAAQDLTAAIRRIALCRREHEPMVAARLPETVHQLIEYWEVEDVGLEDPPLATARIRDRVLQLVEDLSRSAC